MAVLPRITDMRADADAELFLVSETDGVSVFRLRVSFPEECEPSPITVQWQEEMTNILSVWKPDGGWNRAVRQWFSAVSNASAFCSGAPILCTVGDRGISTAAVSVSDPCTPITVSFGARNGAIGLDAAEYTVTFFTGRCSSMREYTADIRVDCRPLPFDRMIQSVYEWWKEYGWNVPAAPAAAYDPVYSSWYSFYQCPRADMLLADLKTAAEMGFRTVILDDGWQFEGASSGDYSHCGDWKPAVDKFPDFRRFADEVHALGMKLMLWFTVPFVGRNTEAYHTFAGKYLYEVHGMGCAVIDPRYPETRAYIKNTYKHYLQEYDVDGFKLDFIDSFRPGDLTAAYNEAMDCRTVEIAVQRLLEEIETELGEIKKDLLYEYRQNYIGPAINRFGNMLRVGDCAYDALTNRIGVADLRMMGYPIAVHSDMLCWSKHESAMLCAKQLINVLFSVPQISVLLADCSEEQRCVLRRFLAYWTENRDLLMHGDFHAVGFEQNYTVLSAENDEKIITALYADVPFSYTGKDADVFSNGPQDGVIVENKTDRSLCAAAYDCTGMHVGSFMTEPHTVSRIPVPSAGLLTLRSV